MSVTITNHTLEKIEQLLKNLGYKVRYEKGNFKTGTCLVESSKMVVVNKFSDLESKIGALVALIKVIEFEEALLNEKQKTFYYLLQQTKLKL